MEKGIYTMEYLSSKEYKNLSYQNSKGASLGPYLNNAYIKRDVSRAIMRGCVGSVTGIAAGIIKLLTNAMTEEGPKGNGNQGK